MDAFNIQSMGNATVFGNLTSGNRWGSHAFSSTTRGLWAGGYLNTGTTFYNTVEFVTIANNGNPMIFGDTTTGFDLIQMWLLFFINKRSDCSWLCCTQRFSIVNTIDHVTMATAGNATNFGDLFQTRANMDTLLHHRQEVFLLVV